MKAFIYIIEAQLILFTFYVMVVTRKGKRRNAKHNLPLAKSYNKAYKTSIILLVVWVSVVLMINKLAM